MPLQNMAIVNQIQSVTKLKHFMQQDINMEKLSSGSLQECSQLNETLLTAFMAYSQ